MTYDPRATMLAHWKRCERIAELLLISKLHANVLWPYLRIHNLIEPMLLEDPNAFWWARFLYEKHVAYKFMPRDSEPCYSDVRIMHWAIKTIGNPHRAQDAFQRALRIY